MTHSANHQTTPRPCSAGPLSSPDESVSRVETKPRHARNQPPLAPFNVGKHASEDTSAGQNVPGDGGACRGRPIRNWPAPWRRIGGWTLLAVGIVAFAHGVSAERPGAPVGRRDWRYRANVPFSSDEPKSDAADRIREGTILENKLGTFKSTGGRIAFYPSDSKTPIHALENLALERVWRLQELSQGRQWSVSGVVTEYRDGNYLLITRAILKAAAY